MSRLLDKTAVVTGAASGIGLAAVTLFARKGAQVPAIDRDADVLERAVRSLGAGSPAASGSSPGRIVPFVADVTDEARIAAAMTQAASEFGGIDILVPNAGIFGQHARIQDCPIDAFNRVMEVNVAGVVTTIKCAVPFMIRRGGGPSSSPRR